MSIYSGFATRKMQQNYNHLLSKLISLFQQHILQFMSLLQYQQTCQNHKSRLFDKKIKRYNFILSKMNKYQQHKYLQPKFSQICQPLKNIILNKLQTIYQNVQQDIQNIQLTEGTKAIRSKQKSNKNNNINKLNKSMYIQRDKYTKSHHSLKQKLGKQVLNEINKRRKSSKKHNKIDYQNSPYKREFSSAQRVRTEEKQIVSEFSIDNKNSNAPSQHQQHLPTPGTTSQLSRYRIHRSYDKNIQSKSPQSYCKSKCKDIDQFSQQNSIRIFQRQAMTSKTSNILPQTNSKSVSIRQQSLKQKQIYKSSQFQQQCSSRQQRNFQLIKQFTKSTNNMVVPTNIKAARYKRLVVNSRPHLKKIQQENTKINEHLNNY